MRDSANLPSHLQEYLDNSAFKMEDQAGTEDVLMTREFGDEKYDFPQFSTTWLRN